MTFQILKEIIEKCNIPEDVELRSDSGWECGDTRMDGVYYNAKGNLIIFTQNPTSYDRYFRDPDWELVYGEPPSWDRDFWEEKSNG